MGLIWHWIILIEEISTIANRTWNTGRMWLTVILTIIVTITTILIPPSVLVRDK